MRWRTYAPRYLLARITSNPKITILNPDLPAGCFRITPLEAPRTNNSKIPTPIAAFTEYEEGSRRRGSKSAKDESAEVKDVTRAEATACRLILPSRRCTFG